ncbi:MAG: hypothetical protein QOJ07_2616, partial [Thermoleophilaceae bacterium]|nr:hypothetical protein [Thermoleophilaceae bacterium]
MLAGYRVEGVVARGGMGVVYRATQLALDRPVALKVIAPEVADDPAFRARFGRESRLAASIDHANVIPVHEAGEAGGLLYITMRLVDGIDLGRMIARDGPLEPVRAAGVIGQVAAALDAAHARGLVHRDVKPANVLVAGDGHVYLTDFGLVKSIDSDSGPTQTGQVVGTVNYVAPEQIHGSAADARADVYALGCLTFQVLTGELPFARETPVATMWAHSHDPPPRIGEQRPELAAVDEVLARALAKDPADRFPSAGDLARALSASVAGEHVAAPERSVARGEAAGEATQGLPSLATAALAGGPATPATRPETPDDESTAERSAPASGERGGRRVLLIAGAILLVLTAGIVALQLAAGAGTGKAHDALAAKTLSITPIALRGGPRGVAVGEGGVWVSNNDAGTVSEIDPGSNTVTGKPVTVGQGPDAIAAGEGYVWVVAGNDGRLFRIDPGSHEVTGAPIEVGYGAGEVATGGGYVWVADSSDDAVLRIDPKANRVVGKPIALPTGVGGA